MTGTIFDIKEFSLHDGPGARITIFLKGCPLRCLWCHNPEGLKKEPQLMIKHNLCIHCGKCLEKCSHKECKSFDRCLYACPNGLISLSGEEVDASILADKLMQNANFLLQNNGGITISGGEPMFQPDFVIALTKKMPNMHMAIQTSGYTDSETFQNVIAQFDYIMMDIKIADRELHKKYTGVYNDIILKNFKLLQKSGKDYVIRVPLIPSITDTIENLKEIYKIVENSKVELLEYNSFAGAKYPMVGMKYPLQ